MKTEQIIAKVVQATSLDEMIDTVEGNDLLSIAEKRGIKLPSPHLAIFKTVYAKIEEANRNGVRLSRPAVEEALPTLIGKQVNLNHWRKGFVVGHIIDAELNDMDEIIVSFVFYKDVYLEDYDRAIHQFGENDLTVSFELNADTDTVENLSDGTRKLHNINFAGMGLLLDEDPAYPGAIVFEMAKRIKNRIAKYTKEDKSLIFASQIVEQCDEILEPKSKIVIRAENPLDNTITDYVTLEGEDNIVFSLSTGGDGSITYKDMNVGVTSWVFNGTSDLIQCTLDEIRDQGTHSPRTSSDDSHWHNVVVDVQGNGETVDIRGMDQEFHKHIIVRWEIQEADGHTHLLMNHALKALSEARKYPNPMDPRNKKNSNLDKEIKENKNNKKGGEKEMAKLTVEETKALKAELGDLSKDWSEEDYNDEKKVAEARAILAEVEKDTKDEKVESTDETNEEKKEDEVKSEDEEPKAEEAEAETEGTEDSEAEAKKTDDTEADAEESTEEKKEESTEEATSEEKPSDNEQQETADESNDEDIKALEKENTELKTKVEESEKSLKELRSTIEAEKENAVKIADFKRELGDYVGDFSDADFLDPSKIKMVRLEKENHELKNPDVEKAINETNADTGHNANDEVEEVKNPLNTIINAKYNKYLDKANKNRKKKK